MMAMAESSRPGSNTFRRFYRVFRWVVLAGTIVVVILILRQAPPPQVDVDPAAGLRLQHKMRELQNSLRAGRSHTLRLAETEVNSWVSENLALTSRVSEDPTETAAGAPADIQEVRSAVQDLKIELAGDRVQAYVVFDFHGRKLTLILEGRLQVQEGQLRFEATAGQLGSLPIPQMALDRAVQRLFESPQNRDQFRLPPEIGDIYVENSELVISFEN